MLDKDQSSLIDCLIAQSIDLICICDENATIVKINKAFLESIQRTSENLLGTAVETLFSVQNQKLNNLLYNKILNLCEDEHFTNNLKITNNSLKSVSWQISKFQNLCIIRGTASKSYVNNPSLNNDERLKAIVDHTSDCFFTLNKELNIVYQNTAALHKFAHPHFTTGSNNFFGSFPEETNKKFFTNFLNALNKNEQLKFVEFSSILNCWFNIEVLPCGNELNVLVSDISDRIIDHKINELELKTFELNIAKDRPVNEILLFLLRGFEELYPRLHASILKVEDGKIWHKASPNLPLQFCWAIDGQPISANAGSCGSAAYLKKSVITFDIETDEKWTAFHHLISPRGYKSCWSFPIISNKTFEVMATFALYTKANCIPTENELKSIARLCNIIKIIFEELKQDDALLLMNNRYEMVTMATNDAIYDWDLKSNDVFWSENLYNIFGFTPQEAHDDNKWWIKHIHKDDRAETISLLKQCLRKRESGWVAMYRLECKNGSYKHVYNRGYIIYDSQNLPTSIIGALQDITRLKEREIEITSQNDKLKEIAQISSHELRRPVTSILGLISLFNRENVSDEGNTLVIDYLQKAAEELDDVIHSIVAKTLEANQNIIVKPHKSTSIQ